MAYKLKTHSGAKKRFRKTATGKVKRGHAFARHILTSSFLPGNSSAGLHV